MGKLLEKYMSEYNEAIKPGLEKGDAYIIKPQIWIYFKWESDNGVAPWEPVKYRAALKDAILKDPELGQVLIAGMGEVFGQIKKEDLQ